MLKKMSTLPESHLVADRICLSETSHHGVYRGIQYIEFNYAFGLYGRVCGGLRLRCPRTSPRVIGHLTLGVFAEHSVRTNSEIVNPVLIIEHTDCDTAKSNGADAKKIRPYIENTDLNQLRCSSPNVDISRTR